MTLYLSLKALHIIAVIAWMAGMLYLPRLFVYHSDAKSEESREMLKVMERRLLKFIMTPELIATWGFGLLLIWQMPSFLQEGWLHTKFLLVILLSGIHGYLAKLLKAFARDENDVARFGRGDGFFDGGSAVGNGDVMIAANACYDVGDDGVGRFAAGIV